VGGTNNLKKIFARKLRTENGPFSQVRRTTPLVKKKRQKNSRDVGTIRHRPGQGGVGERGKKSTAINWKTNQKKSPRFWKRGRCRRNATMVAPQGKVLTTKNLIYPRENRTAAKKKKRLHGLQKGEKKKKQEGQERPGKKKGGVAFSLLQGRGRSLGRPNCRKGECQCRLGGAKGKGRGPSRGGLYG